MSIRTIKFKVEADKITPSSLQRGGLQGEHNATELEFWVEQSLAEKLESASMGSALCYRFEGHTGTGMKNSTLPVRLSVPGGSIKEFTLKYPLENWLTREGGNITVYLIFSILSNTETLVDIYSYPARLKLEAVPDGKYTDGKNYESVAKLSVAAEEAAERAENAAEISEAAKEQTVDARFALENGAEFIFIGGDASGAAEVDLVVDGELSGYSTNSIQNQAVAKEFEKYTPTEELNQLLENLLKDAKLAAHPVGSYYWSANATSPSELFGGTWEQIKDRFVLAAGDIYDIGLQGGEATVQLKEENMPKHKHMGLFWAGRSDMPMGFSTDGTEYELGYSLEWHKPLSYGDNVHSGYSGGDKAHNNMPPYITAYCWKRVA